MQEYKILTITEDSQHDAVEYIDDEKLVIIKRTFDKQFLPASEFFNTLDIKKFIVEEGLG